MPLSLASVRSLITAVRQRPGQLAANPLFVHETRRLLRSSWRSWHGWSVLLLLIAHVVIMARYVGPDHEIDFAAFSFLHLCWLFTGFHLFICLAPPIIVLLLRNSLRDSGRLPQLRSTPLSARERVDAWLVPRYLLSLTVLLLFYFSMFPWHSWLYELEPFTDAAEDKGFLLNQLDARRRLILKCP